MSNRDFGSSRWKALIRESEAGIERYLVPEINIDLASFIRSITFRAFLVVFMNVDPDTLTFANVQRVTGVLSDFYDDKEGERTLPTDVRSILDQWLPQKRFPSSLDRILPAYEALWRIVAMIVVTCEEDETKALRWVMLDFRDNPRDQQYRASIGSGESVSAITDDVVSRLIPIARPQHATASNWPLSCIQNASGSNSTPPTVQEALKFAALLASGVIGRVGVHYGISGNGVANSQASPWDRRKIFRVNRSVPGHVAIHILDILPHAGTSRQIY
ncbi:hypothetical protein J3R82DRAFT_5114 [Butyriboletus roseoflavus]|nr:hypothetical protein J3R82DRAFT_5114 [Butyriboletus roseoflavus]